MGAGNYLPRSDRWKDVHFFYISHLEDEWEFEDLMSDIENIISPRVHLPSRNQWINDMFLLGDNGHYEVTFMDWGVYYVIAVGVTSNLGHRSAELMYRRLVMGLQKMCYELYRRTGPWTSVRLSLQ